jgi:hydrogenase expression/formation protein HypD
MSEGRFRDAAAVERVLAALAALAPPRPLRFMHVCGTHENALCEFGLRSRLPAWLTLVAGPGCPVCVCPASEIDLARRLAVDHGVVLASFGDVMRVPARGGSLLEAKAAGADCRVVYGIDDAVALAAATPAREVVFFAVGFETTACTTAAVLARGVPGNFSVLTSHRLVPPALRALLALDEVRGQTADGRRQTGTQGNDRIDGFILPGHVTAVTGLAGYRALGPAAPAMAVAGFEPVELALALLRLAEQAVCGEPGPIHNLYPRAVRDAGNPVALRLMDEVFTPADAAWRGIGVIPASGLRIRPHLAALDAQVRFGVSPDPAVPDTHKACRCGDVLLGRLEPEACPLFGAACNPDRPLGPCMVAFEGTCHARYRHRPLPGVPA